MIGGSTTDATHATGQPVMHLDGAVPAAAFAQVSEHTCPDDLLGGLQTHRSPPLTCANHSSVY